MSATTDTRTGVVDTRRTSKYASVDDTVEINGVERRRDARPVRDVTMGRSTNPGNDPRSQGPRGNIETFEVVGEA